MGLFSRDKKVKTPEEELVDELVGLTWRSSDNLREVLLDNVKRADLENAVKKVWKNGGSVYDIQKVYDETLEKLGVNENFHKGLNNYRINRSKENDFVNSNEYLYGWTSDDGRNYLHRLRIIIFKKLSLEDILGYFKTQVNKWNINTVTLGDDSAFLISRKEWFENTPYYVVLKKNQGPMVVCDNGQINFDNWEDYFINIIN
ncbi:hypothetical protein [Methanobrevibacter filiformis]|uniref:Uncharacterized protein n=1 Tax=Methanobrevibacter filiformis TaxID=55758 RepID=A0A166A6J0_9EURY|nr:hypothetical protein [Methanobrevibacter filiformis]KZX11636.1 hypothetical protein MBFIL_13590 [Methanobrevibacter filiformis]